MAMFVMPDLVGQHADDLLGRKLLHQRVIEHDTLLAPETGEVGVRFAAALRRVDDIDIVEPEVHPGGEGLDGIAELAFRQRRLLVEERDDELRVEILHEEREKRDRAPGYEPEPAGCQGIDPGTERQDGAHDDHIHQQALDRIGSEEPRRGPVETEALLDDERPVQVEGNRNHPGKQIEDSPEYECLHDGMAADGAGGRVEEAETAERKDGQGDQRTDQVGNQGELPVGHRVILLFPVARLVVEALQHIRDRSVRRLDIEQGQDGRPDELRQYDGDDQPVERRRHPLYLLLVGFDRLPELRVALGNPQSLAVLVEEAVERPAFKHDFPVAMHPIADPELQQ